jgi:phage terminase large subunit
MVQISLEFAELYEPLFTTNARYIHLWGGRGRGGSFTGTQYYLHLVTQPEYFRGYLMRLVASDIRESLWRDFKDRVEEAELEDLFHFNESQMSAVCIPTGNMILSKGFKKSSGDRTAKLKSIAGATHVLIEEAEEISEDDFKQLDDSLRTTKTKNVQVIKSFNPPDKNHWFWKRWYRLTECEDPKGYYRALARTDPSLLSIFSTYHDNLSNLSESFITNQINYQGTDPDYYHTRVNGLISEGKIGRIYRNWQYIDAMPNHYGKFYGLDFGFNDPVALVECEAHNQNVYLEEKIYETGLTNKELSDLMIKIGISKNATIYADCAEPKSIKELRGYGWTIVEAEKGPDSIINGIKFVKQYNIYATEKSTNLWFENQNYTWKMVNKIPTNEPEDQHNHLMDAIRYAMTGKLKKQTGWKIA